MTKKNNKFYTNPSTVNRYVKKLKPEFFYLYHLHLFIEERMRKGCYSQANTEILTTALMIPTTKKHV